MPYSSLCPIRGVEDQTGRLLCVKQHRDTFVEHLQMILTSSCSTARHNPELLKPANMQVKLDWTFFSSPILSTPLLSSPLLSSSSPPVLSLALTILTRPTAAPIARSVTLDIAATKRNGRLFASSDASGDTGGDAGICRGFLRASRNFSVALS
eukprot:757991-Hanusia_phi.AAC.8